MNRTANFTKAIMRGTKNGQIRINMTKRRGASKLHSTGLV